MERTIKSWGEKWNIFQNDLNEISILYLVPNQRCSWHSHQTKFNQFFVIEGELFIKTDWDIAKIEKGQIFTTRPGEKHEFQTHDKPATIIEVMYVQYDANDINREELGGPLNE